MKMSADDAWAPFAKVQPGFADYRDASYGPCTYKCTVKNLKIYLSPFLIEAPPNPPFYFLRNPDFGLLKRT